MSMDGFSEGREAKSQRDILNQDRKEGDHWLQTKSPSLWRNPSLWRRTGQKTPRRGSSPVEEMLMKTG